jgi:hypothetical protein
MDRYRQTSNKISISSDKELEQKINSLGAVGNMDISIKPTTPDATDTKQWYLVNYWVRE